MLAALHMHVCLLGNFSAVLTYGQTGQSPRASRL